MIAEISSQAFDSFFAWAPWIVGIVIYAGFYVAKRRESSTVPQSASRPTTYACAACGRRGTLEQMVAQHHDGAVLWQCPNCASAAAAPH